MGKISQPTSKKFDSQEIDNWEHDHSLRVKKVLPYAWDGSTATAFTSRNMAVKITVSGSVTYVGRAAPGSSQSATVWQAKKIDASTNNLTVITWADGNTNFDNAVTDLTLLTYS